MSKKTHSNKGNPTSLSMGAFMGKGKQFDNTQKKQKEFIKKAKQLQKFNRLLRHEGLQKGKDGTIVSQVDYSKYENEESREALKKEQNQKNERRKRSFSQVSADDNASETKPHHKKQKDSKNMSLKELSHQVKRQKFEERKQKFAEEEVKKEALKKSIKKRKRDLKIHTARTKKGQPVMKNVIKDLFGKLQQGKLDGKY